MNVALRKQIGTEGFANEIGGVAADRRHGRGATTNRSGRFEPIAYEPVDDGWESLADLEALSTNVQEVPARKIITRNEFARYRLRPLDQSVSWLRAWLHLLLRAADPCLSRALARSRFRDQIVRQGQCGGSADARTRRSRLQGRDHRHRHQYRSLPADREALPHHAANSRSLERGQSPGRHRHQIGAGVTRSRHSRIDGRARAGEGRAFGDDARRQARPRHGAASKHAVAHGSMRCRS